VIVTNLAKKVAQSYEHTKRSSYQTLTEKKFNVMRSNRVAGMVQCPKYGRGKAKGIHEESNDRADHGDDMSALVAKYTKVLAQVERALHIGCVTGEHCGEMSTLIRNN
jgi:coenzyme F420-reducing hydrogenase alpha subunit